MDTKIKQNRIIYLDAVRIVAILTVIMTHIAAPIFDKSFLNTVMFKVVNIFDSLSRIGVPLFLMISGVMFLDEERDISIEKIYKKYIWRLLKLYVFWSFVYAFLYVVYSADTGIIDYIKQIVYQVISGFEHLWYLLMLIGLYAVTPLLRIIVIQSNIKYVKYFLLMSFICQFLIPVIIDIINVFFKKNYSLLDSTYKKFNIDFVLGYSMYYVLGWYLHNYPLKKQFRIVLYISGGLSAIATIALTYWISMNTQTSDITFYNNLSFNILLYSSAVFVLIQNLFNSISFSENTKTRILQITKLTLGIYLIHFIIIDVVKYCFIFERNMNPAIYIFSIWAIAAAVSFLLSLIVSKIPLIKKIID